MPEILEGRVWVFGDSVDTDNMFPGFALRLPTPEAARHVFYDLRPGWVDEVAPGDIVIAGANFGIGSSRPVALLFRELGVQALVAHEFNSLFFRNCINYGLSAVTVPGVTEAFADGDRARLHVREGWIENVASGRRLEGQRLPPFVLDIVDAGGVLPQLVAQGYIPEGD